MEKFKAILRESLASQVTEITLIASKKPSVAKDGVRAEMEHESPSTEDWIDMLVQSIIPKEAEQYKAGERTRSLLKIPKIGDVHIVGEPSPIKTLRLFLPPNGENSATSYIEAQKSPAPTIDLDIETDDGGSTENQSIETPPSEQNDRSEDKDPSTTATVSSAEAESTNKDIDQPVDMFVSPQSPEEKEPISVNQPTGVASTPDPPPPSQDKGSEPEDMFASSLSNHGKEPVSVHETTDQETIPEQTTQDSRGTENPEEGKNEDPSTINSMTTPTTVTEDSEIKATEAPEIFLGETESTEKEALRSPLEVEPDNTGEKTPNDGHKLKEEKEEEEEKNDLASDFGSMLEGQEQEKMIHEDDLHLKADDNNQVASGSSSGHAQKISSRSVSIATGKSDQNHDKTSLIKAHSLGLISSTDQTVIKITEDFIKLKSCEPLLVVDHETFSKHVTSGTPKFIFLDSAHDHFKTSLKLVYEMNTASRLDIFVVLIDQDVSSNNPLDGFRHSVDLTINKNDVDKLEKLCEDAISARENMLKRWHELNQ